MRRASTRVTSARHASRGGSHSVVGRSRRAPSSSCRPGSLDDELAALAAEGVQSLLLEGGPTIGAAFLAAGLVDRLLVFVAPVLAGDGPPMLGPLPAPIDLGRPDVERVGDDVLLDMAAARRVSRAPLTR